MSVLAAFYDLEYGPISFDFLTFLVRAAKERDERRCTALHVVIVPKENGLGGFSRDWGGYDEHAARWRLWHICVASCPLAGATCTIAPTRLFADRILADIEHFWWPHGKVHFMGPLVDAARRGEKIPKLHATVQARRYVDEWRKEWNGLGTITLTTRDQSADSDRNSNQAEWRKLHDWLVATKCCHVIWLADSHVALGKGQGYAELDPDLRLALYERATLNLIGNNGPQDLLKYSDSPYLVFGLALTDHWRQHFKKYFSLDIGAQLPWAGPKQKMVYRPDTFEVMKEELATLLTGEQLGLGR